MKTYIGIIGGHTVSKEIARVAYETGRLIAQQDWILICGGMGGVMEQACKGAVENNGITIGILPGESRNQGNKYLNFSIVTGLGHVRNVIVARSCQAIIAIDGSFGTLSEIAFANIADIPVIGLKSWQVDPQKNNGACLFRKTVDTPGQAIQAVKDYI